MSETPGLDTRTKAARLFAVPERKVRYAAEVAKTAPELLERVERGDTRLVAAVRQVRTRRQAEEVATYQPATGRCSVGDSHVQATSLNLN